MKKKHTSSWHENEVISSTVSASEDDNTYQSKSKIKRDADMLKKLGTELIKLNKNELAKLSLDEELFYSIELAKKIKKEGYRRQIQWIGKLLRHRDSQSIREALNKLKNRHHYQHIQIKEIEQLQHQLLETGNTEAIISLYPTANRQLLRHLVRSAKKEKQTEKPPKSAKQLYQYLKELSETK